MGLKAQRKNIVIGNSTFVNIPAGLEKGKHSTMACNRLMLVDPRGEISEKDLLDLLEGTLEPEFYRRILEKGAMI